MGNNKAWLYILCILLQLFVLSTAQSQDNAIKITCNFDKSVGTYTTSSTFEKNIQAIPSFLNSPDKTFHNFSVGNEPDTVNVIALCRGDLDGTMCQRCLNLSYNELTTNCNREKESIIWKDECMLRYSNRAIFNTMSSVPNVTINNSTKASDPNDLNKKVKNMLVQLRDQGADHGSSLLKFATANINVDENTVFGLVQCTPDLTTKDCKACLDGMFDKLPSCCGGNVGARYLTPSCNFRYETGVTPFYYNTNADIQITGKGKKNKIIIIVVIILSTSLVMLTCIVVYIYYGKNKKSGNIEDDTDDELITEDSLHFDLNTIKVATNDFSDDNKLGRGGFGVVYKGTLPDGREIAVKRLLQISRQHELEFKTEVLLLAKLQHRNLLRLLGYSLKGAERLLIYEFIANGSLDNYIVFDKEKHFNLDAETRIKIVKGVARGLLYLHEDSRLRIIHRDLKPSNILLDEDMHPKIADFGMARLFEFDETRATTKNVVGTYGYIAPEYVKLGHFSDKSDVYSFGVVALEIITGKKKNFQNGEEIEYLPSYVWKNWRDGRVLDVIDPILRDGSDSMNEMTRCVHIALLCVQENVADRPTMASVLLMLSSAFIVLPAPSEAETHSSSSNSEKPPTSSSNQASITELIGR